MKKRGWFSSVWLTMVLLPFLLIPSQAGAMTSDVKVIELTAAATASIPIEVPPGRAGLQPKLNLNYNSYRKDGWIGMGWDLGMGAIQRSTKRGVDYDAFDFVAFGQEMVPVDTDGSGNGSYQAKIEGEFTLYEFSHSDGWVVTTKNGTKYYYGQNTDSRQDDPNDSSRVFKWCLDKAVDPNGNYMTVNYEKDKGQIYLKQIDYTGNEESSTISPNNSIIFYLEDGRPDQDRMYTTNFKEVTAKRLKMIEVRSLNNEVVRAYKLIYSVSSNTSRSLLTSVQEFGGEILSGTALQPTELSYSDPGHAVSGPEQWSSIDWRTSTRAHEIADVNGDGKADFISFQLQGLYVWTSDGTGLSGPEQWSNIDWRPSTRAHGIADVNGDGKADFISFQSQGLYVWTSDGTGLSGPEQWSNIDWLPSTRAHGIADVNGDGKADFISFQLQGLYVWTSDGTGLSGPEQWSNIDWRTSTRSHEIADVNGDGKADFISFQLQGLYVWTSDGTGLSGPEQWSDIDWRTSTRAHGIADVNGDGKADFISFQLQGLYVWTSDGTGLSGPEQWSDIDWRTSTRAHGIADVNGDGKADFISFQLQGLYVWPVKFGANDLLTEISNSFGASTSIHYSPSSSYENTLLPFILHPVSKITTEVTMDNGNGIISEENYTYKGGYFDHPYRAFRGFKEVIQTSPNGTTRKTAFYQGNPEADDPEDNYFYKGRTRYVEVRGAGENSNLIGRTEYTWGVRDEGSGSQFVYLDEKVTRSYENGQQFLEVHEDNIDIDAWGNLLQTRTWDTGASAEPVTNTFEYANYGSATSPLWRKTMELVAGDSSGPVRQVWYRYTNDGRANLEEKEHWNDQGDNPVFRFEYYDNGNVWKEWDPKNQLIAEYTYDSSTETFPVQVKNALGHNLNKTYDPRFGAVTSETDANQNATFTYLDAFGRPERMELPNGGETLMEYHDGAFPRWVKKRVLESDAPASYIDAYEYFDGLGRTIQTVAMGEGGNKQVVTRTFYDEMGREKETYGPFFVAGTTEGVLHPVPSTDVPRTWTDYDLRSRPTASHVLDGDYGTITSTVTYDGLSTTAIDADGAQKTTVKDYLGRVKEVVEHTDTGDLHTVYTYNAAGDLTQVRDPENNLTSVAFDTLGRKINMTDPDMGYWQYQYDANGNLTWQKDANNREIQIQYDVLDRITAKNYLTPTPYDHNVTYTYDDPAVTQANPLGSLSRETNGVVTTTYNSYDELGQVLSISKTISGDATRTTQYDYDLSGKLLSTVYPDNYQVNNSYHAGTGLLHTVVGITDFTSYVTYTDYPATGQIKKAVYGNSTETTYTRDPYSTRLTAILTKDAAGAAIIDRGYGYTQAGDIEDINDNVKGISYFYTYDKLHRLTGETNSGSADNLSYDYNDLGGFTTKSNGPVVMTYGYDTAHIHAVKTVTVAAATYTFNHDANGNMTNGYDFTDPLNPAARTIAYNSDNMPAQIVHATNGTTTFVYDGSGTRAKKSGPNGTTYYYGALFEKQGSELIKYIFAKDQRVAMVKSGGAKYFHKDHLGSTTVVTDGNIGLKISGEESEYLPFGGQRGASTITVSNYGFTNQEKDPETGLYNYNARFYDPSLGVFISADTIVPDPGGSQAYNRYAYCANNPLIYTDPSGHFLFHLLAAETIRKSSEKFHEIAKNVGVPDWIVDVSNQIDMGAYTSVSPVTAFKEGGVLGGLGWHTGGLYSYSYDDGSGVHIGGSYYCFYGSLSWQEKGRNAGWTGMVGVGYKYGYATVGLSFTTDFRGNSDILLSAGAMGQGISAGVHYSLRQRKLLGYSHISLGELTGFELRTSENTEHDPDGRPMVIRHYQLGDQHITGRYNSDNFWSGELSPLMSFLDTLNIHATAVVHDWWVSRVHPHPGPTENILTMFPSYFTANAIAGQKTHNQFGFRFR